MADVYVKGYTRRRAVPGPKKKRQLSPVERQLVAEVEAAKRYRSFGILSSLADYIRSLVGRA